MDRTEQDHSPYLPFQIFTPAQVSLFLTPEIAPFALFHVTPVLPVQPNLHPHNLSPIHYSFQLPTAFPKSLCPQCLPSHCTLVSSQTLPLTGADYYTCYGEAFPF